MSLFRDRQVKCFSIFIMLYLLLGFAVWSWFCQIQIDGSKSMYLTHDKAVISSLLEQGVSKKVIAAAISSQDVSTEGENLSAYLGLTSDMAVGRLSHFSKFQRQVWLNALEGCTCLTLILGMGIFLFLRSRHKLYQQAQHIVARYIDNDYSAHLPQGDEGEIYHLFAVIERLATMLQAKSEMEYKSKAFLKASIADISHQLKTPLAALMMYQEIIEAEPDQLDTVKEFSQKIGNSLTRMEQLILALLKITRLDAGCILFDKRSCFVKELIKNAISELITRADCEEKEILIDGTDSETLICDMDWTSEAIGNLVKNALDHTEKGGIIKINWERTPTMLRILVSDNGNGIAPEDIYHIFKRFYRAKHALNTPGIGLGLALAKSIIEGQGGMIAVQSTLYEGTTFSVSFLTNL